MTAHLTGTKLVRRTLPGRMTTSQRMTERNALVKQESKRRAQREKAQRAITHRRRTGCGVRSTGLREKARLHAKRSCVVDDDGFLEIVKPTETGKVRDTKPSSGYNVPSGGHAARNTSPSRGMKRLSEKRPLSGSLKRRKEEAKVTVDVIDLAASSQEHRHSPSQPMSRLKKNPKAKRKRETRTKMVALPVGDSVFSPQIGGSPTGSSRNTAKNKPTLSKRTGGDSRRLSSVPVNDDPVLEVDR